MAPRLLREALLGKLLGETGFLVKNLEELEEKMKLFLICSRI